MDKTRTKPFYPQSNAVTKRMDKESQSMFAKCVNEEQSSWTQ